MDRVAARVKAWIGAGRETCQNLPMTYRRYALYYTPTEAGWSHWATRWLGWDMTQGTAVAPPEGLDIDPHGWTDTPRRYGLHATLKPPFRLAQGEDFAQLTEAFQHYCDTTPPVEIGTPALTRLGRFLALMPTPQPAALTDAAAGIVRAFDPFRAPASDDELARRRAAGLSPDQEANLTRWGYPYVMEGFRFHITLTEKLSRQDIEKAEEILTTHLLPLLPERLTLDALSLAGEDDMGRFHLIERRRLAG